MACLNAVAIVAVCVPHFRMKNDAESGFLDSAADEIAMETAKENGEYSPEYVRRLQERVRALEKERKEAAKQAEASESARSNKRQRLEIESVAVSKSEELKREVATLRIQLENNSQRHQIELKERDAQLDQLRRQLQYAVAEEEETLKELKAATNDHSAETLRLEKKVVELEAQLDLVEANLNEWKEKALEASSQLRALKGQSTMKLKEKSMEAEHAAASLLGAKETLESASDVRALNERITQLQSTERKLKTEVGEFLLPLEYEHTANSSAVIRRVSLLYVSLSLSRMIRLLTIVFDGLFSGGISLGQLKDRPAATVIQLYKARQNAFEILFEQKGNVEIQRRRLEKQCEKLQSDLITSGNHCAKLEMQLAEVQQKISGANDVVVHLRKVNEELVEILETYGKNPDDHEATDLSTKRVALLESSLKQSQELIKGMESTQKVMATPAAVKKYEARIERLEKALADAKHENGNLSKHLEKVEMELAIFEKRLGRGEFNVETTKIVHLAVNPTHEMLQNRAKLSDIEKLRQENALLRSKLEKLTGVADTELFRDQIRQYREAVFLLTGFKVDLKRSNGMELLTLRSVYADHDDDELLVRMEANGSLELLETEYCSQINQRVFAYLTTCRSFPAFLSTLTLHLFEKQTFQGN
ncbi:hypothetical protein BBJ28_00011713 [Nothophytophthora sp. Chile5]|nr:hypothetical protein BBJ28_00011713 [Nothophytophthora sp. Chile5]